MTSVILLIGSFAAALWLISILLEPKPFGEPVAPDPELFDDPVVQVYGANVWGTRGRFAIHTWVALKGRGAETYEIYQVIGWRKRRGRPVLSISEGQPDKPWYGSPPILLHEKRGAEANSLLDPIRAAVASYPYPDDYKTKAVVRHSILMSVYSFPVAVLRQVDMLKCRDSEDGEM